MLSVSEASRNPTLMEYFDCLIAKEDIPPLLPEALDFLWMRGRSRILLSLLVGTGDHYKMFTGTYVAKLLAGFAFDNIGIRIVLSLLSQVVMICL